MLFTHFLSLCKSTLNQQPPTPCWYWKNLPTFRCCSQPLARRSRRTMRTSNKTYRLDNMAVSSPCPCFAGCSAFLPRSALSATSRPCQRKPLRPKAAPAIRHMVLRTAGKSTRQSIYLATCTMDVTRLVLKISNAWAVVTRLQVSAALYGGLDSPSPSSLS